MTGNGSTPAWLQFLLRMLIGGSVIALIPLVSRKFSPSVAGVAVLVPVVTLLSFYFIARDEGVDSIAGAAVAALVALPTIAAFLLAIYVAARHLSSLPAILLIALAVWLAFAVPAAYFLNRK
jgi:uncharacterized membrane protein (GlpM family)